MPITPDSKDWTWVLERACPECGFDTRTADPPAVGEWRLGLMLAEEGPTFANWDQDETAATSRYVEEDPARVAIELDANAGVLADRFDAVTADQWQRTGSRGDGAEFTIATFARYLIHDPIHHLHDVGWGG